MGRPWVRVGDIQKTFKRVPTALELVLVIMSLSKGNNKEKKEKNVLWTLVNFV